MTPESAEALKFRLEGLYRRFNRREEVPPDPLMFCYRYDAPRDREVAGLIAACLAYGRVARIRQSVAAVLAPMGTSPRDFLDTHAPSGLARRYRGFVHRFADAKALAVLLSGIRQTCRRFGSLEGAFLDGFRPTDSTVVPALTAWVARLTEGIGDGAGHLLPRPERGSACKRLHLYLRWMVRSDGVDPGGWDAVSPARLIVPIDVHMHRIGRRLGLTRRNAADGRTALEITEGFRRIAPRDPVRYDFALTRLGMRAETATLDALMTGMDETT